MYLRFDVRTVDGIDVSHKNVGFDVNFSQNEGGHVWWYGSNVNFDHKETFFFTKTDGEWDMTGSHDLEIDYTKITDEEKASLPEWIPAKPSTIPEQEP